MTEDRYLLDPDFDAVLAEVLGDAEGGPEGRVVAVDNAASGLSAGRFQMDLSQRAELARRFAAIAVAEKLPGADDAALLSARTRDLTSAERARAVALGNSILATDAGKAALTEAEAAKFAELRAAVRRVARDSGAGARDFLAGLRGQIELACHLHQFGTGSIRKLQAYLRGEAVAFEFPGAPPEPPVAPNDPLDLAGFRAFRAATRWGREFPRARESRDLRIDRAFARVAKRLGIGGGPGDPTAEMPRLLRRAFARAVREDRLPGAVRRLQRLLLRLNRMADSVVAPPPLEVDGKWGPQSRAALARAIDRHGAEEVGRRFAMDAADEALRSDGKRPGIGAIGRAYAILADLGPAAPHAIALAMGAKDAADAKAAFAKAAAQFMPGEIFASLAAAPEWRGVR
ncbi:MAG: hypothetical protein J0H39_16725 [Alphaproteobacteria bacterium]|nr:hypothetical protein [Alphaproteobacteria bacterium]